MDGRPIGVFDSGAGGLNVLCKLAKSLPGESFIYYADSANMPYGDKTRCQITYAAKQCIDKLFASDVKLVVVGCNTASLAIYGEDIKDVIALSPAEVIKGLPDKNILFAATPASVGIAEELGLFDGYPLLRTCPMSGLAQRIEDWLNGGEPPLIKKEKYMPARTDVLYLGCTHYLFAKRQFRNLYKRAVTEDGTDRLISGVKSFLACGKEANGCQKIFFKGERSEFYRSVYINLTQGKY